MRRVEKVEFSRFAWDEAKRHQVFEGREIDFLQVAEALMRPHAEQLSHKHGEARKLAICEIDTELVAVVYVIRDEICRIITARAARRHEREEYRDVFGGRDQAQGRGR